ncbi:uncharacterized protein LOC110460983 isoform X2 [Mizuhopecten yessoensis]|uniref:uncharacterized protein LOC110460983 isoform X2 n=1 Tax=Mizuhopecten yessoensis TaxID=6573 RepID=UPI000B45C61D|nr:uncharacterized protein LOC110460983 isoform X2 [Mizuhopecten yessoensis]
MRYAVTLALLVTLTFANPRSDLLSTLNVLHDSATYQALPPELRLLTVELAATAKAGQLTSYIDKVGFYSVLNLIRHLPVHDAHDLEDYLLKVITEESIAAAQQAQLAVSVTTTETLPASVRRSKRSKSNSYLHNLESTNAYQSLPQEYKGVLKSLLIAAHSNTLTQYLSHDVTILPRLLHHMNPGLARRLNAYFMQLRTEGRQNSQIDGDDDDDDDDD